MDHDMERVNRILKDPDFVRIEEQIANCEKTRIFCHHGFEHLLDVARVGVLMAMDEDLDIPRDIIYAAALLHDIGKGEQYTKGQGIDHEQVGAELAAPILEKCGYEDDEIELITEAIAEHRNYRIKDERNLKGLLYRADKASRKCFACKVTERCHKAGALRVMEIKY